MTYEKVLRPSLRDMEVERGRIQRPDPEKLQIALRIPNCLLSMNTRRVHKTNSADRGVVSLGSASHILYPLLQTGAIPGWTDGMQSPG